MSSPAVKFHLKAQLWLTSLLAIIALLLSASSVFSLIEQASPSLSLLAFLFALCCAAIAYSNAMIIRGQDIGHKTYPASWVALLLVSLMIYRWWSELPSSY